MSEKLKIALPVVVEGRYDKIKLDSVMEGTILTTGGFSIFNNKEKQQLLRKIAGEYGVILLTDSDGGGRQIRAFLHGILPAEKIHELFIPKIAGKEPRKKVGSKSGTLGVEGMEAELLRNLLSPFAGEVPTRGDPVTAADFYLDGFSGGENASQKRAALAESLGLPADMTAKALLAAVNLLCDRDGYETAKRNLETGKDG